MAKLLIYYSENHNKFKTKFTKRYFIPTIGSVNQYNERLIKVINEEDLILDDFSLYKFLSLKIKSKFSRLYK